MITDKKNGSTPTQQQLTQTFTFNPAATEQIGSFYGLSVVQNTLTSTSGDSKPQVANLPVDLATLHGNSVANTPFATYEYLIQSDELGGPLGAPAAQPACNLYTLEYTPGTSPTPAGAVVNIPTRMNNCSRRLRLLRAKQKTAIKPRSRIKG